ncbi:hypothetical protein CDAR_527761 [Caerostris darwini]|uniref:Uncharacterized protein n=1 Tax=Caerostris darwini TaxID=1538125 RepID=A0AAV4R9B8_9ARAC|nr:hypothetical protein CDAR_527761 [Caerostris darwini]
MDNPPSPRFRPRDGIMARIRSCPQPQQSSLPGPLARLAFFPTVSLCGADTLMWCEGRPLDSGDAKLKSFFRTPGTLTSAIRQAEVKVRPFVSHSLGQVL